MRKPKSVKQQGGGYYTFHANSAEGDGILPDGPLNYTEEGKSVRVALDPRKLSPPHAEPAIPQEAYAEIGRVIVNWSNLEASLNDMIVALLRGSKRSKENWQLDRFTVRRRLFMDLVDEIFPDCPDLHKHFKTFLDEAQAIKWKRDVLAHGDYTGVISRHPETGLILRWLRVGTYFNGKYKVWRATPDQINDLYYLIAHLTGKLDQVFMLSPEQIASSPQIQRLRDYLESNHPRYTNGDSSQPPHPASHE